MCLCVCVCVCERGVTMCVFTGLPFVFTGLLIHANLYIAILTIFNYAYLLEFVAIFFTELFAAMQSFFFNAFLSNL